MKNLSFYSTNLKILYLKIVLKPGHVTFDRHFPKNFMMALRRKGRKTNKPKVNKVEEGEPAPKHNPCAFFDAGEVTQIKGVLRIKEVVSVNSFVTL